MIDALIIISEITKGMKSVGSKALLKVNDLSIIEHQINQVKAINRNIKINIVTGFDHDRICKLLLKKYKNINIIYNDRYSEINQAGDLLLFLNKKPLANKILLINNGIIFKNSCITNETLNGRSKIYLLDKPKNNFIIGCNGSEKIEYLFYDLPCAWSECLFLNSESISLLKDLTESNNMDQMYLFEIINKLMGQNILFDKVFVKKNNILKINGVKDLPKIRNFI